MPTRRWIKRKAEISFDRHNSNVNIIRNVFDFQIETGTCTAVKCLCERRLRGAVRPSARKNVARSSQCRGRTFIICMARARAIIQLNGNIKIYNQRYQCEAISLTLHVILNNLFQPCHFLVAKSFDMDTSENIYATKALRHCSTAIKLIRFAFHRINAIELESTRGISPLQLYKFESEL